MCGFALVQNHPLFRSYVEEPHVVPQHEVVHVKFGAAEDYKATLLSSPGKRPPRCRLGSRWPPADGMPYSRRRQAGLLRQHQLIPSDLSRVDVPHVQLPDLVRGGSIVELTTEDHPTVITDDDATHEERSARSLNRGEASTPSEREEGLFILQAFLAYAVPDTNGPDIVQVLQATVAAIYHVEAIGCACSNVAVPSTGADKDVMLLVNRLPAYVQSAVIALAEHPQVTDGYRLLFAWHHCQATEEHDVRPHVGERVRHSRDARREAQNSVRPCVHSCHGDAHVCQTVEVLLCCALQPHIHLEGSSWR
mmetsp:Transcript_21932/g.48483  ORF Transcript_21932/g.48483 Transcript_21932/m.48483 type:complete len:307 (-) Transcript_21932:824-1744(-)